jgi:hypothetical protein
MAIAVGDWMTWAVVFGVMIFQYIAEWILGIYFKLQVKITLDVLEHMKGTGNCKECIRNIFTNLAIVAALIMTIAFAMLFLADHLEDIEEDEEDKRLIAHAFIAATGYGSIQSMRAMVESVLNLIYTEALSGPEINRFLIVGPGAIGAPVLALIFSMFSILLASCLYILQMYSVAAAAAFGILAASRLVAIAQFWLKRARFTTSRDKKNAAKWTWAEDPNAEPPRAISKKCSKNEITVMRERAREALLEEQSSLEDQSSLVKQADTAECPANVNDNAPSLQAL